MQKGKPQDTMRGSGLPHYDQRPAAPCFGYGGNDFFHGFLSKITIPQVNPWALPTLPLAASCEAASQDAAAQVRILKRGELVPSASVSFGFVTFNPPRSNNYGDFSFG
jgi:putative alpha-1,2-mannosidase